MNICMVAYTNYLTDARPRREAEALTGRGDIVDFIALSEPGRSRVEVVNGVRLLRVSQSRYRGASGVRYLASYIWFFCVVSVKVVFLFIRKRYGVIYVHTMPDFMVFVGLIPKMFGAKIVLDMHDMMPELYMSKFGAGEHHLLIRAVRFQERLSFEFADRVICVHEPHRHVLLGRGAAKEKLTALLNLPDPSVFGGNPCSQAIQATNGLRLVYHGTVAKRLGLDIAVIAFQEVLKSIPDAHFDIYGDGDFSEHLEGLIQEHHLEDKVFFSKRFFHVDEIPSLIKGATMGIIANRRDTATEYMLPVKMLEYIYLHIPVVAPRLSTISHYFQDDAIAFYTPEDQHDLAQQIIDLYNDEAKRNRLLQNAQPFIDRFSWKSMKKDLFNVIDN